MGRKKSTYGGTWDGGIVWLDAAGVKHYTIFRRVNGKRYKVSTGCTDIEAALAQYPRFQANPEAYSPGGSVDTSGPAPILLSDAVIEAFHRYSLTVKRNTPKWAGTKRAHLRWLRGRIGDRNLRALSLDRDILPHIPEGTPGRMHRVEAIKHLFAWLRETGYQRHAGAPIERLTAAEDPTLNALQVPRPGPRRRKARSFTVEDFAAVKRALGSSIYAHAITVLAGTGWHVTELVQFARGGDIETGAGGEVILCAPHHKAKRMGHRTIVSADVAESAGVLRANGGLSERNLQYAVKAANLAAGLPEKTVTAGSFRHAVVTWARKSGAPVAAISEFVGHQDKRTTQAFYDEYGTPAKVPTLA